MLKKLPHKYGSSTLASVLPPPSSVQFADRSLLLVRTQSHSRGNSKNLIWLPLFHPNVCFVSFEL
jgi:hypothetical protein